MTQTLIEKSRHEAFERSDLGTSSTLLMGLGLNVDFRENNYPNVEGAIRNIEELLQDGVEFEDALTSLPNDPEDLRVKHHFYDPQNNGRPLTLPIVGEFGRSSLDWILLELNGTPLDNQNFSYDDANTHLYQALTSTSKEDRDLSWGLIFQTLGHVIHHMQDMAQPQHTRNDSHLPWENDNILFYELYTEVKRVDPERGLTYSGYPDIDLSVFNTAQSFWGSIDEEEQKV